MDLYHWGKVLSFQDQRVSTGSLVIFPVGVTLSKNTYPGNKLGLVARAELGGDSPKGVISVPRNPTAPVANQVPRLVSDDDAFVWRELPDCNVSLLPKTFVHVDENIESLQFRNDNRLRVPGALILQEKITLLVFRRGKETKYLNLKTGEVHNAEPSGPTVWVPSWAIKARSKEKIVALTYIKVTPKRLPLSSRDSGNLKPAMPPPRFDR